jgi:hypothetical protein
MSSPSMMSCMFGSSTVPNIALADHGVGAKSHEDVLIS